MSVIEPHTLLTAQADLIRDIHDKYYETARRLGWVKAERDLCLSSMKQAVIWLRAAAAREPDVASVIRMLETAIAENGSEE